MTGITCSAACAYSSVTKASQAWSDSSPRALMLFSVALALRFSQPEKEDHEEP